MKLFIFLLIGCSISCKKQENYSAYISQNPKLIFDGKNLIDKNRNDSVICNLDKRIDINKKFNFYKKFDLKNFLISNEKLRIKKIDVFKNKNQFSTYQCLNLDKCIDNDKILDFPITYDIEYINNKTTTVIVEYSFKKEKDLLNAYIIYSNYCSFLRNLKRDKYQFSCSTLYNDMFYYVSIKNNKLYLISDLYNYSFPKPYCNIESEVQQNKEIIIYDVFKLINEN